MSLQDENKTLITKLLNTIFVERNVEAAATLLRDDYIQHSPQMPAGKAGFLQAVPGFYVEFPTIHAEIKHLWADGDYVIAHSLYRFAPDDRGTAIVDMFRVQNGKVAEHWDVAQEVPAETANGNGMF